MATFRCCRGINGGRTNGGRGGGASEIYSLLKSKGIRTYSGQCNNARVKEAIQALQFANPSSRFPSSIFAPVFGSIDGRHILAPFEQVRSSISGLLRMSAF
jgi:hypothetical protein